MSHGHVLVSGKTYTAEEKAAFIKELHDAAPPGTVIDFTFAEDAPDFLPGESWQEYAHRVYGDPAPPKPTPFPDFVCRDAHRKLKR